MSIGLVRKWSDTGAPKLWANTWGSMVRLLEQVLVTGYGSYSGLGWTKEYESPDTNTVVFRNNPETGSGFYLQVCHSTYLVTNSSNIQYFSVAGYESMTAWDTGLSRCPAIGINSYNLVGINATAVCTDGIHWMVIGDDRGFWLCVRPYLSNYADIVSNNNGRVWRTIYLGDIIPYNSANQWPTVIMSFTAFSTGYESMYFQTLGSTNSYLWVMRDSTMEIGSTAAGLASGSSYESTSPGQTPDVSPINNQTAMTAMTVHDANKGIIGILPGARNPLRQYGVNGNSSYNIYDEVQYGYDRTLYTLVNTYRDYTSPCRICLIGGEGFR